MSRTPTSVVVLSILAIILSALRLLTGCLGTVSLFVTPAMSGLLHDATYMIAAGAGTCAGTLLDILAIAGAIASLRLLRWGRSAMILYAILELVVAILFAPINFLVVIPRAVPASYVMPTAASMPSPFSPAFLQTMMIVSLVLSVLVAAVWSGFILYFFTRPHVKAAFAATPGT